MANEDRWEAERIRDSVVGSFDKYAQRHTERYLAKLKSASPNEKEKLTHDFYKVDSLLSKRVFIPGFYVYVLKKVLENKPLMRQRTIFIKASLISIFNQEGVRVRDVAEKPQQPQDKMQASWWSILGRGSYLLMTLVFSFSFEFVCLLLFSFIFSSPFSAYGVRLSFMSD